MERISNGRLGGLEILKRSAKASQLSQNCEYLDIVLAVLTTRARTVGLLNAWLQHSHALPMVDLSVTDSRKAR